MISPAFDNWLRRMCSRALALDLERPKNLSDLMFCFVAKAAVGIIVKNFDWSVSKMRSSKQKKSQDSPALLTQEKLDAVRTRSDAPDGKDYCRAVFARFFKPDKLDRMVEGSWMLIMTPRDELYAMQDSIHAGQKIPMEDMDVEEVVKKELGNLIDELDLEDMDDADNQQENSE